ncbi:hypothetical protein [Bradyrhizobium retamae]|uniref:Uncharacterized protein n=1 Tax=Bradyrhizobium retamae TaxID=1300035 RepID=A0A0R3NDH7_9BRAD|nr:hypothetical protein CQ13_04355 [Bradyrhizobium retamae]
MQREPTTVDRWLDALAVLGRTAAVAKQKRLVDLLDVDAPLNRLDRLRDLEDPARGFFRATMAFRDVVRKP